MLMVKMHMVKLVIFNSCDAIGKQNPIESESTVRADAELKVFVTRVFICSRAVDLSIDRLISDDRLIKSLEQLMSLR